jgi:hypothetical protein
MIAVFLPYIFPYTFIGANTVFINKIFSLFGNNILMEFILL